MKPILFNTEMVRAILEGRKTVTRRVIKLSEGMSGRPVGKSGDKNNPIGFMYPCGIKRPPFKVNDVLYVRETWGCYAESWGNASYFMYRADFPDGASKYMHGAVECDLPKWRPSIHMPKEAARIFLRVTDVRVERLQDICNRGSLQDHVTNITREGLQLQAVMENYQKLIDDFKQLWDSTIKKDQLSTYGWKANPYVWVIEFEVIDKPTE